MARQRRSVQVENGIPRRFTLIVVVYMEAEQWQMQVDVRRSVDRVAALLAPNLIFTLMMSTILHSCREKSTK